jgi:glycosyltransferase involved in cell wall biosynthesis
VALGHFERKGLPILIEALAHARLPHLRLVVVGGTIPAIAPYRLQAQEANLGDRVIFVGMQEDIRQYLWVSDGFVLPSSYETFSLVSLQAAAAGLPLLVTPLSGVEEYFQNGETGLLLTRSVDGVTSGITEFASLPVEERVSMGQQAQKNVRCYNVKQFAAQWRATYQRYSQEVL